MNKYSTVAKCLFMIVGIEVDNRCLFIVHRLSVSVTYRSCIWVSSVVFSYLIFLRFTTNFCIHEFAKGDFVNTTLQNENCKVQIAKLFFSLPVIFSQQRHCYPLRKKIKITKGRS